MSNTRKAKSGGQFRQERYASSAAFERGLMANLVARRCELLEDTVDRDLVWFVQFLSHQEGGLKAVAKAMFEKYSARIGTASMRRFGNRNGQSYDAAQVKAVRAEMPWHKRKQFLLKGETFADLVSEEECEADPHLDEMISADYANEALERLHGGEIERERPSKFMAMDFWALCEKELSAASLEYCLKELCLNPEVPVNGAWPWWFESFTSCLREYQRDWIAARSGSTVTTSVGEKVNDALDYALETKCLVIIDGLPRIGKTFSTKAWCLRNPGRVRYVQVPSTNDEIGFYRAIAKSVGVSINLNSKAQELRQRIEETLQGGQLTLVMDEAHYLWPNLIDPRTVPARVNWILTALVNHGVPVALVTTPQFIKTQKIIESNTRWTSEQLIGRIGHYESLPATLSESDMETVAQAILPEGDVTSIKILVRYAQSSCKYLAGIEGAVRRARYLAAKENRSEASRADIKRAISENVIPSDSAFAKAMEATQVKSRKRQVLPELTADYLPVNDRRSADPQPNFLAERASEQPEPIRLESCREIGALVSD